MKKKVLILALVIVAFGSNSLLFAQEKVEVGNKICPIEGEEIGSVKGEEPVTVEHAGKIYNLCGVHCVEAFLENPEKFSKMVDKEMTSKNHEGHDHAEDGHEHPGHDNEKHHNH